MRYRYLRVQVQGFPAGLLVLGYLDPHPEGVEEVWFSGSQEALRLRNGRVVGATGTQVGWQGVRFTPAPPAWLAVGPEGTRFERRRDSLPGYRFGMTEAMQTTTLPGLPALELGDALPLAQAGRYRWFSEVAQPLTHPQAALPPAYFAWGRHRGADTVVFSYQCLAPDFCLQLQRWPLLEVDP